LKRIIISVTNDLTSDQRVHRISSTLTEHGEKILLVGRKLPSSVPLTPRAYDLHRMNIPFRKGFLFYAFYNIWLFFFLLFKKADGLVSNDLDTLPANYLISVIKQIPLIYDSHEYFTETPEVTNRAFVKKVWNTIEKSIVPKLKFTYTVCGSLAEIYNKKYRANFKVVRNLPFRLNVSENSIQKDNKKIIIYQGSLNVGRGVELVMDALKYLDQNTFFVIAGEGDISSDLRKRAENSGCAERIIFLGKIPLQELHKHTAKAHLGVSLEENSGLNYYYALPNKLFDYIQAGIPVLTSNFPEMSAIVRKYDIGQTTLERNPEKIAAIMDEMLTSSNLREKWKHNLKIASNELCWENEKNVLIAIYKEANLLSR
jgi:glycosyltransferase involved in cell wall biosynthesis